MVCYGMLWYGMYVCRYVGMYVGMYGMCVGKYVCM